MKIQLSEYIIDVEVTIKNKIIDIEVLIDLQYLKQTKELIQIYLN